MPDFSRCPECVESYEILESVIRNSRDICRDLDKSNIVYKPSPNYPEKFEVALDCDEELKVSAHCKLHRINKTIEDWDCSESKG